MNTIIIVTKRSKSGIREDFKNVRQILNDLDYISGGLTFNFPAPAYSQPPHIMFGVLLKNAVFSVTTTYSVQVSAITDDAATVRVVKNVNGTITEAATDDVTVSMIATGK